MSGRSWARWLVRSAVALASLLVPPGYRERFREEWQSELWHLSSSGAPSSAILARSLGVFSDALATGRLLRARETHSRVGSGTHSLAADFKLALRSYRQRPVWAALVLSTLALGIGANTAIFSLVHAVLLRPLAYPQPDRLVKVQGLRRSTSEPSNLSPADFFDLASESEVFESMGAHGWVGFFTIAGEGEPQRVAGSNVTAGFFETLGVRPALGRLFTAEDDRPGAAPTLVLTHALWQARFGGRADVVGKTVPLDAEPHEIVGVLPAEYSHPEPYPDREPLLYEPYQFDRAEAGRSGRFLRAVGRLAEGRSPEQARSELAAIASRLEETYPDSNTDRGFHLLPLKEAIVGDSRRGLLVLYGAVGAVLLIACANLANLQLAQGGARRHALAIQSALGAGRARLIRQLFVENWLLAVAGGALGFLLAASARDLLALRLIPRAIEVEFDARMLGFAFLLSSAAAILFGLAPALGISAGNLKGLLVEGGTRGASSRSGVRRLLIAIEVAISLLLLVAAALFGRSLFELRSVTPGFRTDQVLTLSTSLPLARYSEGDQIPFYRRLLENLHTRRGLEAAGATNILPLTDNYSSDAFQIEERPAPAGERPQAEARSVTPGYFEAMGIPLLRGRLFDARDREGSPGVVVISESMAEKFWPGEDPLGGRITYNRGMPEDLQRDVGGPGSREIVGIVGDVKHLGLEESDVPMFYTPHAHQPSFHTMTLVVRTAQSPESAIAAVTAELSALDPQLPLYSVRPLREVLDGAVAEERFRTYLIGLFAAAALALAVFGVYAVMGLVVVQREREIGIRMALGARGGDVMRMLVLDSMKPVMLGLGLGTMGALFLTRSFQSLLFRIEPGDPFTYLAVAILLAGSALAAAILPTRRAVHLDPVKTLRTE